MWSTASLGKFSTSPHSHCQDHAAVIGRILGFGGIEFTGLVYLARLQAKVKAKSHTNLTALRRKWDRLAIENNP
jgi:hypothetical protein